MPVSVSRQTSSFSSLSISGSSSSSSALSLRDDVQMVGKRHSRVSIAGHASRRAPSVYGGAGGFGTRVSQSVFSFGPLVPHGDTAVITNEKLTMQNLNDRLASYLEKVRILEGANRKLELQIREFYDKKTVHVSADFTHYFNTINELRAQISQKCTENQRITLMIDNARLAAEDFKIKYEAELHMRMIAESDVSRLRGLRDSMTLAISDLEVQIEGLKEELALLKVNHKEEMQELKIQQTGSVNVEVDSAESTDLRKTLQEVREQYETLMQKNKLELEKWFQSKVDTFKTEIVTQTTEVTTSHRQLSELKKTYQSSEINLQSVFTEIQCLQQSLEEIKDRYSLQLTNYQQAIYQLELELQQLRTSIEHQQSEYSQLLDIKMRLELEIAEYRRLLEGEHEEKKTVVISQVVETVEEHKPHIERRVKVITEEIVDGVVVTSSVNTKVEEIQ